MQNLKKKRDPIFTIEDKHILIDVVRKYFDIIENKKTDNGTMNTKKSCWEKLAEEYNSAASCLRSTDVLKNCWKNLKAEGRKVSADERQSQIKTGGGPKKDVDVEPIILRVLDLIRPTAVGLINPYDSDGILDTATGQNEESHGPVMELLEKTQRNVQDDINLTGDWSQYTPGQMRKPRTTILRKLPQSFVVGEDGSISLELEKFFQTEETESNVGTTAEFQSPIGGQDLQSPKRPVTRPLTVDEVAPKRLKPTEEKSTRHLPNRRRPVLSQAKNEELLSRRMEALTSVTAHADEEHQMVMEIHREKLRQERIRTRILILELKEAKRRFKNESIVSHSKS